MKNRIIHLSRLSAVFFAGLISISLIVCLSANTVSADEYFVFSADRWKICFYIELDDEDAQDQANVIANNVNDIIEEQTGNRPLSIGEDSRALICFPSDSNWRDCDPDNIVPAPSGGESYGLIGLLIMNDDESPDGTSYLGLRMWPTSITGKTEERIIDFSTSSVEIERKVAVGHPIGDIGYIKVKAEWRRNIAETPVDGWTIYLRGPPWELQRHTIYGTFYHLIQEGEQTTNYEDIKLKVNLTHDPLRAIFDGPIQWAYEEFGHFETYTLDGPPANCPPPE